MRCVCAASISVSKALEPTCSETTELLEEFVQYTDGEAENLSEDLTKLAQVARRILDEVNE